MADSKPLVSVILTCYNQEACLAETLDSVLSQTYTNWECIVMNDGSSDHSEAVARQYVSKDSRFRYIYQENQGVVTARNNAIRQSLGEYILPLDGDDLIAPDYLSLAADVLNKHQDVVLVHCRVLKFGAENGEMIMPEMSRRNLLKTGCCVSTSMYRRSGFDKVGGYKTAMNDGWEDWEFFISLMETGGKVYKLDKPLFYYRISSSSRNSKLDKGKYLELQKTVVRLHPLSYFREYEALLAEHESIVTFPGYAVFAGYRALAVGVYHFLQRIFKFKGGTAPLR